MNDPETGLDFNDYVNFQLSRLSHNLTRQSHKVLAAGWDLGVPEWRCLALLTTLGPSGINRMAQISGMDKGQVSRTVAALETKGLVEVRSRLDDKRQIEVALTEAGSATSAGIQPYMKRRNDFLLSALTRRERDLLFRCIGKLTVASADWEAKQDDT